MTSALCLTCPGTDRRQSTNGNLCFRCYGKLLGYLNTLEQAVISIDKTRGDGIRPPGFASSPPVNLEALAALDYRSQPHDEELKDEYGNLVLKDGHTVPDGAINTDAHAILGTLHGISESIAEYRGRQWPDRITTKTECNYIRGQLSWLVEQDWWIDELAEQLRELANITKRLSGERTAKAIGRCTSLLKNGECGTKLYAPLHGDSIKCRGCGRQWPREEWLRLGRLLTSG